MAAFVASVAASVYVLLPKPDLVFAIRGSVFSAIAGDASTEDAHRWLAQWLESYSDENQPTIDTLFWWFRIATLGVLGEIILFSISLALT